MQKYKLFGLAPPIWVAQYIYSIDIQRIIKCESKRCQSQEKGYEPIDCFLQFLAKCQIAGIAKPRNNIRMFV